MRLQILGVVLAALAAMAAGCVYHQEVKSEPDGSRMEFSAAPAERG